MSCSALECYTALDTYKQPSARCKALNATDLWADNGKSMTFHPESIEVQLDTCNFAVWQF